jgi:hypothetical protein
MDALCSQAQNVGDNRFNATAALRQKYSGNQIISLIERKTACFATSEL